jgi:hypothetical protein
MIGATMSVVIFALEGFEMQPFTSSTSNRRDVYRMRAGPAVIVIHEMPGITPLVAAFARRVADRGMTAVLPDLLGTPGRRVTIPYALASLARACVSKEFTLLALNKTSPIVDYLRELAAHEHQSCDGPGVGYWANHVSYVGSRQPLAQSVSKHSVAGGWDSRPGFSARINRRAPTEKRLRTAALIALRSTTWQ